MKAPVKAILLVAILTKQERWTGAQETCNSTQRIPHLRGEIIDRFGTCRSGKYILESFSAGIGRIAVMNYNCFEFWSRAAELNITGVNLCGKKRSRGCVSFVKKHSLDLCKSALNNASCETILLENNQTLEITYRSFSFLYNEIRIYYRLTQCVKENGDNSSAEIWSTPLQATEEDLTTANFIDNVTAFSTTGEPEIEYSGVAIEIPITITASVLLLAFLFGLGFACRRKQQDKRRQQSNKQTENAADDKISPYYETNLTSTTRVRYENVKAPEADDTSTDDTYIEPESSNFVSSQNMEGTSANISYVNAQMTSSSNPSYYEPYELTEDCRFSPPIQQSLVEEPDYQNPIPGLGDDSEYFEVNSP